MTERSREARLWIRNALAELSVAIPEAGGCLATDDDRVALGYLGNMRSALAKVNKYVMRAKILLEPDGK